MAPPQKRKKAVPARERRSYRQFCGLAKAMDALGERWTLLIVRRSDAGSAPVRGHPEGVGGVDHQPARGALEGNGGRRDHSRGKTGSAVAGVRLCAHPGGTGLGTGAVGVGQVGVPVHGETVRADKPQPGPRAFSRSSALPGCYPCGDRGDAGRAKRVFQYRLGSGYADLREGAASRLRISASAGTRRPSWILFYGAGPTVPWRPNAVCRPAVPRRLCGPSWRPSAWLTKDFGRLRRRRQPQSAQAAAPGAARRFRGGGGLGRMPRVRGHDPAGAGSGPR